MRRILVYSAFLIVGIFVSQLVDLSAVRPALSTLTLLCLAYIMIEVGLEFTIEKDRLGSYGWDYVVAATAAAFPWIFCVLYFVWLLDVSWRDALLVGRFAAPTSAGVLFAMLAAAGLATTWLFRKVRVLAIFDDLDTILFLIPLQAMFVGLRGELAIALAIITALLAAAYRWLGQLRWSTTETALLAYAAAVVAACELLERSTHVHLEVLLPAFVLGCVLFNRDRNAHAPGHSHEQMFLEPEEPRARRLDLAIKLAFMFLVGCSLPRIELGGMSVATATLHVMALTALSNLGKCFPVFCYRREATLRQRIAAAVAMFPRGEVGAGVLLVAIGYGLSGPAVTLGALSLALNLLLTGPFIMLVLWLAGVEARGGRASA
jgi:Kef-type K+ transport system membrane component KefB